MTDDELAGEMALLSALEYLRSAHPKVPSQTKPRIEWITAEAEEALTTIRGHADAEAEEA